MRLLPILIIFAGSVGASQAALVAYWNFNTLSITTASAPGAGGVPTSIAASQGTGSLSLTGYAGTVDDFAGSTINVLSADPAEESLSLIAGGSAAPFPGNGGFIDLSVSLTGLQDPIITFATRGTSTGFNTGVWTYSVDGINFSSQVGGNTASTGTAFALVTLDLSAVDSLDNASSVILRYTLSGATSSTGNNRIDNLQINATPIPEPGIAVLSLAALGMLVRRRR